MTRVLAFLPLLGLALLVALSGFLLTRGGERATFSSGLIGRPAPAYELARLDGGPALNSEARAGRPYVINMFASWCTPCRAEHPQLMALEAAGVDIVGVAYKDRPDAAARFLAQLGNPYTDVALDPRGRFALEVGTTGVPESFVVGSDGTILAVHRGPLLPEDVEREILPALGR